jgi:3-hydroxybutyryl-CoA dehydrogenase
MGFGIALAFAYAGHRVAVIDMKRRAGHAFEDLRAAFRADLRANLNFLVRVKALASASITKVTRRVAVISLADSRTSSATR